MKNYKKELDRIINEGLTIYTDSNHNEAYQLQSGEYFVQIHTDDETAKYYACRHQIGDAYFASNYGNILSLRGKQPILLKPYNKGDDRWQVTVSTDIDDWQTSPDVLIALTFGTKASPEAEKILNTEGIGALRGAIKDRNEFFKVQLHHKNGYIHAHTIEDMRKHQAENCAIDNLEFLTDAEHKKVTTKPDENATIQQNLKYMLNVSNAFKYQDQNGKYVIDDGIQVYTPDAKVRVKHKGIMFVTSIADELTDISKDVRIKDAEEVTRQAETYLQSIIRAEEFNTVLEQLIKTGIIFSPSKHTEREYRVGLMVR